MSSTLLYLDNTYCRNLNDLTAIIKKIETNHQTTLFRSVRNAFCNGTLVKWLSEGDDIEQRLAQKLAQLDMRLTDDRLLAELNKLFVNREVKIEKPPHSKFIRIKRVTCEFDGKKQNVKGTVSIGNYEGDFFIDLELEVLEKTNLTYTLKAEINIDSNGRTIPPQEWPLNLKNLERSVSKRCRLKLSAHHHRVSINLMIDEKEVSSFKLIRKPVAQFSEECKLEQKDIINKFIESMELVKGETDKFEIFDGGKYKATLTDFYISPVVDSRLFYSVTNKCYNYATTPVICTYNAICDFIDYLNAMTGLKFTIASEAQWLLAAKNKKIKYGEHWEFMRDKWAGYGKPDAFDRLNPVCVNNSGNIVVRVTPDSRSYESRRLEEYFRLVLVTPEL